MVHPRYLGSYIYEEFINVDNGKSITFVKVFADGQPRTSKSTLLDQTSLTPRPANRLWWTALLGVMPTAKKPVSSASFPPKKSSMHVTWSMPSDREYADLISCDVKVENEVW